MIKKTKPSALAEPAKVAINDFAPLVTLFRNISSAEHAKLERDIHYAERSEREYRNSAQDYMRSVEERNASADAFALSAVNLREQLDALPPPPNPRGANEVTGDIANLAALPFIESISYVEYEGYQKLKVVTRANSLYTKLIEKVSHMAGGRINVPEYQIPLPSYEILLTLSSFQTLSNTAGALCMRIANPSDARNFTERWFMRQQINAHWGCSHVNQRTEYKPLCLGEYESEVTNAMRKSLTEGFAALAIYLQTAGTNSAYQHSKIIWAIGMGKKEYNELCVVPVQSKVVADPTKPTPAEAQQAYVQDYVRTLSSIDTGYDV